ncbi:glycosyltransferase [Pendulispora brunnea]|uniref:Glycosyltransferase n=1 Tax=Pendulispora brunnea TaxID=2905690 RepID=A0ABZ2KJE0_9BACT
MASPQASQYNNVTEYDNSRSIEARAIKSRPLRLLFANPGLHAFGNNEGGIKSFRGLIVAMAAAGHECKVISIPAPVPVDGSDHSQWGRLCSTIQDGSAMPPISVDFTDDLPIVELRQGRGGVFEQIRRLLLIRKRFGALVRQRVQDWNPDWVVWENGAGNLRFALTLARGKLALSIASTLLLPFGPASSKEWFLSSSTSVYRRIPKIICASVFMQKYVHNYAGLSSVYQPPVSYGAPPFRRVGRFDGAVTMVNPCVAKGAKIFEALAKSFPDTRFRAIKTYMGVYSGLRSLPNVEISPSREDLDEALSDTSVLVVPSICGESGAMIVLDAMLRGVPVIVSNDGGLPEYRLGVNDCIEVTPLRFVRTWTGAPRAIQAPVRVDPWCTALQPLISDASIWEARASKSVEAAQSYLKKLSVSPLSDYLRT